MIARRMILWAAVLGAAYAAPAAASYPGRNGSLAFTSTQDGARHIFEQTQFGLNDLTGSGPNVYETQPRFSPDGREIVFTRQAPGLPNSEIFVMAADGSGRTELTRSAQSNGSPTWSPDGTRIAFVSYRDRELPNIFVMRSDGTGVVQITHDGRGKSELAWSPRGDRIVFVHTPVGGGDREIYSIRPDGTGLVDLTNDPLSDEVDPAFSPDGAQIVYSGAHHARGSVGADLWIMNADGSGARELDHETNGYSDGAFPAWSPDGSTIAFAANNGSGFYHVWSVPAAGAENSSLISNRVPGGNPLDQEIDWQPLPIGPPPRTVIASARVGRRGSITITFQGTGPATAYRCRLRGPRHTAGFAACHSPQRYRGLRPGRYTFQVIASAPGEHYTAPARRGFRIH
jgi:dipeptidyl aminopeptidase/acylaminoacyl peptidase